MTARKLGGVNERVGGGEERKKNFHSLTLLSFFGSCSIFRAAKTENAVPHPSLVILCSETTRKRFLRRLIYHTFCFKSQTINLIKHGLLKLNIMDA